MGQIAVNLLPEAKRLKAHGAEGAGRPGPGGQSLVIGVGTIIALVVGLIVFAVFVMVQQANLGRLDREWKSLAKERAQLEHIQAEQKSLAERSEAITKLIEGQSVWTPLLNQLSDAVPDGVWYTRLVLDQPSGTLVLGGSALAREGGGMQSVSRLLNALQAEQTFTSVFQKITLQSVTTRMVGSVEVLDFTIECLRAVAPPPAPVADTKKKSRSKRPPRGKK